MAMPICKHYKVEQRENDSEDLRKIKPSQTKKIKMKDYRIRKRD
jgi:hypothetical protein